MNKQIDDNQFITDYLLGSLSATETERLDEISFTDDEFAARLQAVENELVDAYVRGELKGNLRQRFESVYLSSAGRREKVKFAEGFLKVADAAAAPPQPSGKVWWKASFGRPIPAWFPLAAAASLLFVLGGLVMQDVRLSRQRDQARTERETLGQQAAALQAQVAKQQGVEAEQQRQIDELRNTLAGLEPRSASEEPRILPFVLQSQTRGISRIADISVPAATDYVTFQLELELDDHASYQATLKSIPGSQSIWSRSGLRAQRRDTNSVVVVSSRAALLNSGNYIWEVTGERAGGTAEVVGSYVFRVMKE